MQKTENYNLKQPDVTDPVHVSDLNSNMAILDSAVHDAQTTAQEAKTSSDDLIKAAKGEQPTLEQLTNMSNLFSDPVYDRLYALGYTTSFSEDDTTWKLPYDLELTGYNISVNNVTADIFDTGYLTIHDDITKDNGKNWGTGENSSLDATLADIYSKIGGGGGDNAKADAMYDALDVQATSEAYPAADKLIPLYNLFEPHRMTVGDRIISTSGYSCGEEGGRVGLALNECNINLNDGVINLDDGVIRFGDNSTEFNRFLLRLCPYTYEDEEGQPHDTSKVELDGYFGDIHLDRGVSVGKLDTDYIMEITDSDVTFSSGWPGGKISLRDTLTDIYDKIEEGGGGGSEYITITDDDIFHDINPTGYGWFESESVEYPGNNTSLSEILTYLWEHGAIHSEYIYVPGSGYGDILNTTAYQGASMGWLDRTLSDPSFDPTSLRNLLTYLYDNIDSTEIDNDVTIKGNLTVYTSTDDNDDEPTPTLVINDDWYGFKCNTYAEFSGYVTVDSILSSASFSTGDASIEQLHAGSTGEIVTITEDDIQFTEPLASQMTSLRDVVTDIYDQIAHVTPVLPNDITLPGYLHANEVTSTTDISAGGELTVTGNTSVGGDLTVAGGASIEGTVAITGYMTVDSIEAGDDGFSTGYMLLDAHDLTNKMGWPFIDMEENPPAVSDGGGPESLSTELANIYNMLLNPSFINDVEVNANLNVQYNISASSIETGYLAMDTSGVDIIARQGTWPAYTGEQGHYSLAAALQDIYDRLEDLTTRILAIENGA